VSLELLDLGAAALGPLIEEVVFVGGASVVQAIPRFDEWIAGALRPDAANQARVEAIVLPRLAEIVDLA